MERKIKHGERRVEGRRIRVLTKSKNPAAFTPPPKVAAVKPESIGMAEKIVATHRARVMKPVEPPKTFKAPPTPCHLNRNRARTGRGEVVAFREAIEKVRNDFHRLCNFLDVDQFLIACDVMSRDIPAAKMETYDRLRARRS